MKASRKTIKLKFAIIRSQFNDEVTAGLYQGALEFLKSKGIRAKEVDSFEAPGAFEIPLLAKKLAQSGRYAGLICLGAVIKGETAHFEYISASVASGLMHSMLDTEVPMAFGVLTAYTEEQALARSRGGAENKGREAAAACFEMARRLALWE